MAFDTVSIPNDCVPVMGCRIMLGIERFLLGYRVQATDADALSYVAACAVGLLEGRMLYL